MHESHFGSASRGIAAKSVITQIEPTARIASSR